MTCMKYRMAHRPTIRHEGRLMASILTSNMPLETLFTLVHVVIATAVTLCSWPIKAEQESSSCVHTSVGNKQLHCA